MVLVIGATGKTGIHLVKLLEENGEHVRAATRNPSAFSLHVMGSTKAVKLILTGQRLSPLPLKA